MKPPFLLLFVLVLPSAISADQDSEPWAVGDCILAQFSMNITIYLGKNESGIVIQVPSDAQVQTDGAKSSCGAAPNATDQSMTLGWYDKQANDSIPLYREITIKFKKDEANG